MRSGWARENKKKVWFGYDSQVFANNPLISPEHELLTLRDWETQHGYVESQNPDKYIYRNSFKAIPGDLFLTEAELTLAKRRLGDAPFILVEPHIKGVVGGNNRDWGWGKWQQFVDNVSLPVFQCGDGKKPLDNVNYINTKNFRDACAVLYYSELLVTTNGGLHHAAAALKKPAVVIWGGYNDPKVLGYSTHTNLYEPSIHCLGQRQSCKACRDCMDKITVERVLECVEYYL